MAAIEQDKGVTPDLKSDPIRLDDPAPDSNTETAKQGLQTTKSKAASEKAPRKKEVTVDGPTNGQLVNSEASPNNGQASSETKASNGVVLCETQPSSDAAKPQMQHGNEVAMPETQTSDNDIVMSEANSTVHTNNQFVDPEHLSNDQFTEFHLLDENQMPIPESLHNFETEPLQNDHPIDTKLILGSDLAHYETVPNNHQLSNSEFLSDDHLENSQMLSHYELENGDAVDNNQLAVSEAHYEIVNAETHPSYEIIDASAVPNDEGHTPETQPSKRRKKKSMVWEHFTIETVSPECRRASCKQCKQSFAYSTGNKVAGTSHLKRHISKGGCSAILRNQRQNQLTPYTPRGRGSGAGSASDVPKRRYRSPSTPYMIFDQDRCRHEIAKMIIMHDYPLHMVEHPGFVAFVQNLQPQFHMVTFNTIQGDCVAAYLREKQNLMKIFEAVPGRVSLTLDMWTSQSVGYVFITGYFVDIDWKLQKRVLNVVMEPYPDSESALSHAVAVCLSDWSLDGRLFSITFNQALNGVAPENLRPLLSVKNPLVLNGQLVLGNCIARNLSSVATDLLGSAQAQDIVSKIRDSVKYVKTSESHEEKFLELKQQLQVPCERDLLIDDQSKWNTTYQMLVAASELKEVFSCLDTSDADYKGALTMEEWKLAETLCTHLKPIYDVANILSSVTNSPSVITIFQEVWKLQLDYGRAVTNEDPFISDLTKTMQVKIEKYWRECSLVLAIAVVMDPRLKMKFVEYSFSRVYGDDAHAYIKMVDDGIHELFQEYEALPLPLTPAYTEEEKGSMKTGQYPEGTELSDNGLTDFDAYIMQTSSQQMKSELDVYLEESLLPRVQDIDVLGWWRVNRVKYPTLSKIARDILCVAASTVPADSVFDTTSKQMDQYRSSLQPETVEALVCAKDWMQYGMQ